MFTDGDDGLVCVVSHSNVDDIHRRVNDQQLYGGLWGCLPTDSLLHCGVNCDSEINSEITQGAFSDGHLRDHGEVKPLGPDSELSQRIRMMWETIL